MKVQPKTTRQNFTYVGIADNKICKFKICEQFCNYKNGKTNLTKYPSSLVLWMDHISTYTMMRNSQLMQIHRFQLCLMGRILGSHKLIKIDDIKEQPPRKVFSFCDWFCNFFFQTIHFVISLSNDTLMLPPAPLCQGVWRRIHRRAQQIVRCGGTGADEEPKIMSASCVAHSKSLSHFHLMLAWRTTQLGLVSNLILFFCLETF